MSTSPLATALAVFRAIPLKLVLLIVVLSMTLRNRDDHDGYAEFYPFSNYPMYSKFDGEDYYLFLADHEGKPIPSKDYGITTPKVKKRFKKRLDEAAERLGVKKSEVAGTDLEAVAIETLKTLDDPRIKELSGLQMFLVELRKTGPKITSEQRMIGEIKFDAGGTSDG